MKQKIAATISLITLALILALSSCAPISEGSVGGKGTTGSGGKNGVPITITLPPLGNASIRALSSEQVSRLQKETASYRVVFSGDGQNVTLSGRSSSFSASFPVGTQVSITVYCLNADGEVIVETVTKTITVSSGTNRLDFKLSEDGTEIIPPPPPSPPAPPSVKSAVSYELDGGDWSPTSAPPQTEEYDEGATVTITTNEPTKQGFTFLGWKSSVDSLVPSGGGDNFQAGSTFTMPPSAVTFTAQWTNKPVHDVTYDLGFQPSGGSQTSTVQVAEDSSVSLTAPSVERKGYTFKQWLYNGTAAPSDLKMSTSNITLTAEWTLITYSITYNPDGGNVTPSSGDTEFDVTTGSINLPQANGKTGYTFSHWKAADGTNVTGMGGEQLAALVPSGSTTLALTAVWTPDQYTITYDIGTGNVPQTSATTGWRASDTYTVGTAAITLPTLSATGYTFGGWQIDGATQQGGATYTPTASVTATAVWTAGQYTVTYSVGSGNVPQTSAVTNWKVSDTYTVGTTAITLPTLSATGYTFGGWQIDGATQQGGATYTPTASVTATAQWTPDQYTITYDIGTGDVPQTSAVTNWKASDTYTVGTTAITLPNLSAKGYTFGGWAIGGAPATQQGGATYTPTANVTATAQWTLTQYTINVVPNGATQIISHPFASNIYTVDSSTVSGNFTSNVIDLADLSSDEYVYSGKVFNYWSFTANGPQIEDSSGGTGGITIAEVLNNSSVQISSSNVITLYPVWKDAVTFRLYSSYYHDKSFTNGVNAESGDPEIEEKIVPVGYDFTTDYYDGIFMTKGIDQDPMTGLVSKDDIDSVANGEGYTIIKTATTAMEGKTFYRTWY